MSDLASNVRFTPAGWLDQATGLLGWVTFTLGDVLRLDGVAVRRTREGRVTLSFPRGSGKYQPVRPLDNKARRVIEREILGAIDFGRGDGQ